MIGKRFNYLTVIEEVSRIHPKIPRYTCLCDCGNTKVVEGRKLREGTIKSCGCYAKLKTSDRSTKHGMTNSSEYKTWCGMKRRCLNKNDKRYKDYGARNINICDRWIHSFEKFFLDMGSKPHGYSIERIDNNGNYEPNNCVWMKISDQTKNKRSNILLTYKKQTHILADWSRITGIKAGTIKARLDRGWPVEKALS